MLGPLMNLPLSQVLQPRVSGLGVCHARGDRISSTFLACKQAKVVVWLELLSVMYINTYINRGGEKSCAG